MKTSAQQLVLIALFVAVICVCAIITVPLGPVPFTLLTFAITLCAYLLNPKNATFAYLIYLAIGALGLPVFASFRGGIGSLVGPSGGFLIGYAFLIFPITYLISKANFKSKKINAAIKYLLGIVLTLSAYVFGCAQYMFVANVSLEVALLTAVVPFIVIDLVKIACALAISEVIIKQTDILKMQMN